MNVELSLDISHAMTQLNFIVQQILAPLCEKQISQPSFDCEASDEALLIEFDAVTAKFAGGRRTKKNIASMRKRVKNVLARHFVYDPSLRPMHVNVVSELEPIYSSYLLPRMCSARERLDAKKRPTMFEAIIEAKYGA